VTRMADHDDHDDGRGRGHDWLLDRFEAQRSQLRAVAYRMLGSIRDADDALQESWLRVERADASDVDNVGGWFTTIVARVCLNMLRSRSTRREDDLDVLGTGARRPRGSDGEPDVRLPDPVVALDRAADPERDVLLADAIGLALLVVLDTLTPAERLAFVLHDMFAVPFDDIAPILDRSPAATRQLASRARRRVRGAGTEPDVDLARQRAVVDAFFAAAHRGDFEALLAVLDPDVVIRADTGPGAVEVLRGAATIAGQAISFRSQAPFVRPAVVNGVAGAVVMPDGRLTAVMAFTVRDGRVVEIHALSDPERLANLELQAVPPAPLVPPVPPVPPLP
jgi:RNA polymerase sigma factor (sigma-70 family)